MSIATIRLPDEPKARVAEEAKRGGMTAHNFILEAIAVKADLTERYARDKGATKGPSSGPPCATHLPGWVFSF